MCKSARRTHGTAARSVPVAHLLASEARRDRARVHVNLAAETPLYAFSRAIDRESLAGLCNSLKLLLGNRNKPNCFIIKFHPLPPTSDPPREWSMQKNHKKNVEK